MLNNKLLTAENSKKKEMEPQWSMLVLWTSRGKGGSSVPELPSNLQYVEAFFWHSLKLGWNPSLTSDLWGQCRVKKIKKGVALWMGQVDNCCELEFWGLKEIMVCKDKCLSIIQLNRKIKKMLRSCLFLVLEKNQRAVGWFFRLIRGLYHGSPNFVKEVGFSFVFSLN